MSKIILAIDPGKNGGIVVRGTEGAVLLCQKMPETELDLLNALELIQFAPHICYLEKVGARPMQGASGMWKFAEHYGNLRMCLTALKIPYELVLPNTWQKSLSCQSGGDKKVTYRKAQELFTDIKVHHWNADALLISEYGFRKNNQQGETK